MDPEGPTPGIAATGTMLGELTDEAIDAFVAARGPGSGTPLLMTELRHLGGALGRARERHGALDALPRRVHDVRRRHPGDAGDRRGDPRRPRDARPTRWRRGTTGSAYLNFVEEPADPAQFYSADAYARLRRVKAEVDPEGRFRGNHAIAAA